MRLKGILASVALAAAVAPAAFADKKSEAYVQTNANSVLSVLKPSVWRSEPVAMRLLDFRSTPPRARDLWICSSRNGFISPR